MPYIPQKARQRLDAQTVEDVEPLDVGELTYVIYLICKEYFECSGNRFQQIAEVRGALWSTLSELDRRIFADYENKKCKENGDVT